MSNSAYKLNKMQKHNGIKYNKIYRQDKIIADIFYFLAIVKVSVCYKIMQQYEPSGLSPLLFSVPPWSHSFCNQR